MYYFGNYRVYKKFVRKLIHYGNKKIFYGYTGCIKSSYENFNLNFSPRIFRPFRKANSIKKFSYYRNVSIFVPTFYTPCRNNRNDSLSISTSSAMVDRRQNQGTKISH